MKHYLKFIVLFCAVMLCAAQFTSDARKRSSRRSSTTSGVVHKVNSTQFKNRVADYDTRPFRLKGNRPVVIDFYATWCGPCRRLAPYMDQLARQYAGRVDFYSVDVDANKDVWQAYRVRNSIPTVYIISTNGRYDYFTGLPEDPISTISNRIDRIIY
ncbi:MAG: redoxin domain-containing protein [Muribaculaceae bacterium]|nr:redoxin domain-containing protein [Muribaculaceae bacterium]